MGKKNKKGKGDEPIVNRLVYTTHPEGNSFFDGLQLEGETTADEFSPSELNLRVYRDKKRRAGKVVTVVMGWRGNLNTLKELGKSLKQECGVGGTVKDNEILIQGDYRDKIVKSLIEKGYKGTKPTGG
jgi:translation initiation factor 1